jgi:hypothetical protein
MESPTETSPLGPGRDDPRVDPTWRLLSLLLGVALAFAATVMVVNALDVADALLRDDPEVKRAERQGEAVEYYDGSSAARTLTVALGMASGALALVAAVLSAWVAATARVSPLVMPLTGTAIVLGVATIVINNV